MVTRAHQLLETVSFVPGFGFNFLVQLVSSLLPVFFTIISSWIPYPFSVSQILEIVISILSILSKRLATVGGSWLCPGFGFSGVGVGVGVVVGFGVGVLVAVGFGVFVGFGVGVFVAVGFGVFVGFGVGVLVAVGIGFGVGVFVAVGTGVGVLVGSKVGGALVGSGVAVGVKVAVGAGVLVGRGVGIVVTSTGTEGAPAKNTPASAPTLIPIIIPNSNAAQKITFLRISLFRSFDFFLYLIHGLIGTGTQSIKGFSGHVFCHTDGTTVRSCFDFFVNMIHHFLQLLYGC